MTEINPNTKNAAEQLIQRVANPVKERDVWFHSEIKDRRSGLVSKQVSTEVVTYQMMLGHTS